MKKRKQILFLVLAAILFGGFFAKEAIVSAGFKWYLKGYCKACLGGKLSYADVQYKSGQWILEQPVISTKKDIEDGGFKFRADRARINAEIFWLARTIDLKLFLENPKLEIGKGSVNLNRLTAARSNEEFRLFRMHTYLDVPQGSILVNNSNSHPPIPLYFSINLSCNETRAGCASIWLGDSSQKEVFQGIKSIFRSKSDQISVLELDFIDLDLALLQQSLKGLGEFSAYTVSKGSIKGKLAVSLPSRGLSYAEGDLLTENLELLSEKNHSILNVPTVNLHFSPKIYEENGKVINQTIGNIDIPKPSSWRFFKGDSLFWSIDGLKGTIAFKTNDEANFDFHASCSALGRQRKLHLNGQMHDKEEHTCMAFGIRLSEENDSKDVVINFATRRLSEQLNFAEVQFHGITKEEIEFIQHLDANEHPQWQLLHVHEGSIDGSMFFYMHNFSISRVSIENMSARQFAFSFEPWEISGNANKASGKLSFDLSADHPIETLNADLNIVQGKLSLSGLDQTKWQLADIHTNLAIRKGILQKSVLKGIVAGLKGEISLDSVKNSPFASLSFKGPTKDLAKALPEALRRGIDKKFENNQIEITSNVAMSPEGLLFKGNVSIIENEHPIDHITFGFALEKSSTSIWRKWPPDQLALEYYTGAGIEVYESVMPSVVAPISAAYRHLIKKASGIAGFVIKEGWFEAENLPLEKYVSPFAFPKDNLHLSGFGDFKGTFDSQNIVVHYDARDFILQNDDFAVELKSFNSNMNLSKNMAAIHVFDLINKRGFGTIPVHNATYFEKNSGLLFTDVHASISLEDGLLHATGLETFCNGIYFAGAADVDWSMPGDGIFEVDIRIHKTHGKISQVQDLFSHFKKRLLFKLPLEGNVDLHREGGYLHFAFEPNDYRLQTHLSGMISDGVLENQGDELLLQEVSMNFEYDHADNTLEFTDIQGALLVGTPSHFEEYEIVGDRVHFTDYAKHESEFDIWVGDKKRDIIRLAGKTFSKFNGDAASIGIELDRARSHFGNVHPSIFELTLKDWSEIEIFQLAFDFQLKTILFDLQRFGRTGLLFISRSLIKELNSLKNAQGEFKANLQYDGTRSLFTYDLTGTDIAIGTKSFNSFSLIGKKKGNVWTIDQLQLDDISLAVDILKDSKTWNINFLGARFGKSLLLGMEGKFLADASQLTAKINLLEAKLEEISAWPILQQLTANWQLAGHLQATGKVVVDLNRSLSKGLNVDLQMNGSLKNCNIKGFCLQDINNMSFQYTSGQGFILSDVRTALKSSDGKEVEVGLILEKGCCNLKNRQLAVKNLRFNIPATNLDWLAENLKHSFPRVFTSEVAQTLSSAKTDSPMQGSLQLDASDTQCNLRLILDDGIYKFMGQDHHFKDFVMDCNPNRLNLTAKYQLQGATLGLNARALAPDFDRGEIVFFDLPNNSGASQIPLTITWQKDPHNGFFIHRVEGSASGMSCDLVRDTSRALASDILHMAGRIEFDGRKSALLLNPETAAKVASWQIGNGYALQGLWQICKGKEKCFADSLFFNGELMGRDFEFFGYKFNNLSAQMSYSPQDIHIRHLLVTDSCGSMEIEEAACVLKDNEQWHATMPILKIRDFRPSLLRAISPTTAPLAKTFVVRQLELHSLTGILGSPESFTGYGRFSFANPPKKNLHLPIFTIPAEILMRIGLDLAVLNPVRGIVEYEIKDKRIELKRFKDVYSKGRLSKFYLPNNGHTSYVDFDGNLNMQVRMKQYNLIFKLAELFTVTVQGTLAKPTYTLQKQPKKEAAK